MGRGGQGVRGFLFPLRSSSRTEEETTMNDSRKITRLTDAEDLRSSRDDRPAFLRAYFQERGRKPEGTLSVPMAERRVSPLEW
jgi:hypothetical protein